MRAVGTEAFEFFRVPASLYRPGDIIEEDLYFLYQGQYVLYRLKNLVWKEDDNQRLREVDIQDLFMKFLSKRDHQKFLEVHLAKVLDAPQVPVSQKAKLLYQTSQSLVEEIFEAPGSSENIKRSMKSIKNTIDFLGKGKENFFELMSLATSNFSEYSHALHTAAYSIAMAHQMGIKSFNQISAIGTAALLHDIGKSRVARSILDKPGPLTADERALVEQHPQFSYEIVKESRSIPEVAELIILQHHERPNGKGYPHGMSQEIHAFSKLVALGDVFDSLTSDRVYQKAMKPLDAIEFLRGDLKEEYDQNLLIDFIRMLKK